MKIVFIRKGEGLQLKPVDPGKPWAAPHRLRKLVDGVGGALRLGLKIPILAVVHPAGQPETAGGVDRKVPKANPLHGTADPKIDPPHPQAPPFAVWIREE